MSNTSLSLAKVSNEVISSNDQLMEFREKLNKVANLVFPETYNFGFSPTHKVTASVVTIDTNVDSNGNGRDIYRTETGGYALHLTALNRISKAANLIWTDSRILNRMTDDNNRVVFIEHQVKWKLASIDGSVKEGTSTGKYDYYKELSKSEKQANSSRKHAEARAESNAKYRAINDAIAEIPRNFTHEELKKPFIVPCIVEDKNELLKDLPPEMQAEVKKLRAAQAFGVMDQMYPSKPKTKQLTEKSILDSLEYMESNGYPLDDAQKEMLDKSRQGKAQSSGKAPSSSSNIQDAQVISDSTEPSPAEKNHIIAEEFRGALQAERTEKIITLCKLKGIKNPSGAPVSAVQIEKKSVDEQIKYLEKILAIPDAEEDLPL